MNSNYLVGVKIDGNAAGLARASKEALQHVKQMGAGAGQEFSKMARARELLGVRPEAHIRQEILKTKAAYQDIARVGTMSWNDQRRAAAAMRTEVGKLTNEMGKLTKQQKLMRGLTLGAGAVATGALIAPTVRKTMAYDLRLAYLANTGYSERDKAGRMAGRNELDAKVSNAVKYGGGTRDSALDTLELLLGAGIFKTDQIDPLLRESVKAATANNADPASFANMAIKANKSMGIAPEQMGRMFGIGTFAGQSGGFEIKNMAKDLPAQMAFAKQLGMSGERGFAKLVAVNQAAVTTAGTPDEAGINVNNLLSKMGSDDTQKQLKKLGIDLPKRLAEGRMKGIDAFDVMGDVLDGQLAKDKNYQNVKKQLLTAKDGSEREEALKSVGDIAQGTVIGKVFQDRQALLALIGFINDRERVNKIAKDGPANADAADRNFELVSDTASFKADQTSAARDMAFQKTMDRMMPAIGGVADGLTGLMTQYPGYTTAIIGAATAVTGLAGAAGLAALALGKGGALPGGLGLPGGKGGGGKTGMLKGFGKVGGLVGAAMMFTDLFYTSPEEIAMLDAADRSKSGGGSGIRGQGFNDPRIIGSSGAASAAALEQSLRATEVKGEIFIRVSAAPGINVQTELHSGSPRIPMKAALGQTMRGAGE